MDYLASIDSSGLVLELFGSSFHPEGVVSIPENVAKLCIQDGRFGVRKITGEYVPPPVTNVIPESVTRFQAKAALALMKDRDGVSYLSMVETYMATKADEITKLAWMEALSFIRDSPMVTSVAAMLELTDSKIDDLFCFASTITA